MAVQSNPGQLVGSLRDTVVALVRRDGPDLSARQLGVFLTVYLGEGPHTVRGLAASLNVSKTAPTRALARPGARAARPRPAPPPPPPPAPPPPGPPGRRGPPPAARPTHRTAAPSSSSAPSR